MKTGYLHVTKLHVTVFHFINTQDPSHITDLSSTHAGFMSHMNLLLLLFVYNLAHHKSPCNSVVGAAN